MRRDFYIEHNQDEINEYVTYHSKVIKLTLPTLRDGFVNKPY